MSQVFTYSPYRNLTGVVKGKEKQLKLALREAIALGLLPDIDFRSSVNLLGYFGSYVWRNLGNRGNWLG